MHLLALQTIKENAVFVKQSLYLAGIKPNCIQTFRLSTSHHHAMYKNIKGKNLQLLFVDTEGRDFSLDTKHS